MQIVNDENVDEMMSNIGSVMNSEPFIKMFNEYHNKIGAFVEKLVTNLSSEDFTSGPLGIFLEMQKSYYDFSKLIEEQDRIREFMTKKALNMD